MEATTGTSGEGWGAVQAAVLAYATTDTSPEADATFDAHRLTLARAILAWREVEAPADLDPEAAPAAGAWDEVSRRALVLGAAIEDDPALATSRGRMAVMRFREAAAPWAAIIRRSADARPCPGTSLGKCRGSGVFLAIGRLANAKRCEVCAPAHRQLKRAIWNAAHVKGGEGWRSRPRGRAERCGGCGLVACRCHAGTEVAA